MSPAPQSLTIEQGRTLSVELVWLSDDAAGRDLTQAVALDFAMRRNVEDATLAFAGGVVAASSPIDATLALSADDTAALETGRYCAWGVRATFADGVFQVAGGVAYVAQAAP
jgi:hypothetical protein